MSKYEGHLTFRPEPLSPSTWAKIFSLAHEAGFAFSCIQGDIDLGPEMYWYLTTHGDSVEHVKHKLGELCIKLPVRSIRRKVEEIHFDQRAPQ